MIPVVLDLDTAQFAETEQTLKAAGAPDVMTAKADVGWCVAQSLAVAGILVSSPETSVRSPRVERH